MRYAPIPNSYGSNVVYAKLPCKTYSKPSDVLQRSELGCHYAPHGIHRYAVNPVGDSRSRNAEVAYGSVPKAGVPCNRYTLSSDAQPAANYPVPRKHLGRRCEFHDVRTEGRFGSNHALT